MNSSCCSCWLNSRNIKIMIVCRNYYITFSNCWALSAVIIQQSNVVWKKNVLHSLELCIIWKINHYCKNSRWVMFHVSVRKNCPDARESQLSTSWLRSRLRISETGVKYSLRHSSVSKICLIQARLWKIILCTSDIWKITFDQIKISLLTCHCSCVRNISVCLMWKLSS